MDTTTPTLDHLKRSTVPNPYDLPNDCAAWNAGEPNERSQALDALIEACGGR